MTVDHTERSVRDDRAWAALAHLGIPFFGPLLPLGVLISSEDGSFRKAHARQALVFQCFFLVLWVGTVIASVALDLLSDGVLPVVLLVGLLLETPQIRLALLGKPPIQISPVEPARESSLV